MEITILMPQTRDYPYNKIPFTLKLKSNEYEYKVDLNESGIKNKSKVTVYYLGKPVKVTFYMNNLNFIYINIKNKKTETVTQFYIYRKKDQNMLTDLLNLNKVKKED